MAEPMAGALYAALDLIGHYLERADLCLAELVTTAQTAAARLAVRIEERVASLLSAPARSTSVSPH